MEYMPLYAKLTKLVQHGQVGHVENNGIQEDHTISHQQQTKGLKNRESIFSLPSFSAAAQRFGRVGRDTFN